MKNYTKFYELIAILKRSNRVSSIPRQPPPPSEGGSARKRLRYRGKGAQNLKNLCRKTKKKEKTVHKQKRGAQNFAYLADIWFRVVQVRSTHVCAFDKFQRSGSIKLKFQFHNWNRNRLFKGGADGFQITLTKEYKPSL